jgi:hypothetical protein
MIDVNKTYRTRDGSEVRGLEVVSTNITYPIVGEYRFDNEPNKWLTGTWTKYGRWENTGENSPLDLIAEPATQDSPCLPGWRWVKAGEPLGGGDWTVDPLGPVDPYSHLYTASNSHTFIRQLKPIDLSTCTFGQRLRMSDGNVAIYLRRVSGRSNFIATPSDTFIALDDGQVPGLSPLHVEEVL